MRFLSGISLAETERNDEIRKHLTKILGFNLHEEPNTDKSIADGVHIHVVDNVRVASLIMELKRELDDGGSDPSIQAGLMMKRTWIQANCASIRDKCCCPTLILAGGGPWMAVLGGVFTDKIIVQRLTDFLWVGNSSTHEDTRVYHFAKVLNALRECIIQLKAYYDFINSEGQPLELKSEEAHPRFFPHPTTFTNEKTQVISFQYLSAMEENEPTCVTFKAKILAGDSRSGHVVVKFVPRYSAEVHKFLAEKGYAPNLLYIGPLPNVPKRSPAQHVAPYGLSLSPMQMVVMEYVETSGSTPDNARTQLEAVLTALHARGYVFGDLRRPNILFDTEGVVKLIDFDWAGRYDQSIQEDLDCLSGELRQKLHISDNENQQGNYAYYPLNLSPSVDWAEGVKDLKPIRPAHDWDMLKKLKL
ncbi:hypothetical protein CPC08DRAFT_141691 [Agrocybe pediades]|nr:hypothetical protein CPC08DRAFT_141691 [Agrocybe pediades]